MFYKEKFYWVMFQIQESIRFLNLLCKLRYVGGNISRFNFLRERKMKFDLNKFACKKLTLQSSQMSRRMPQKLGNSGMMSWFLKAFDISWKSTSTALVKKLCLQLFVINILRDNCLANCSLLSESDSTVEKVES